MLPPHLHPPQESAHHPRRGQASPVQTFNFGVSRTACFHPSGPSSLRNINPLLVSFPPRFPLGPWCRAILQQQRPLSPLRVTQHLRGRRSSRAWKLLESPCSGPAELAKRSPRCERPSSQGRQELTGQWNQGRCKDSQPWRKFESNLDISKSASGLMEVVLKDESELSLGKSERSSLNVKSPVNQERLCAASGGDEGQVISFRQLGTKPVLARKEEGREDGLVLRGGSDTASKRQSLHAG